jgi:hypothetical protein
MVTTATPANQAAVTHTITLASLASDTNLVAGREGTAIDNNGTDDAIDSQVGGKVTTGTSPTASRQIEIWLAGSYDGTTFSGGATGSDANLTPSEKTLLKLLTIIPTVNTSNKTYQWGPFSVAQAFGGTMPRKWSVYVVHNTGVALNATAGNHEVKHTPVKYESA